MALPMRLRRNVASADALIDQRQNAGLWLHEAHNCLAAGAMEPWTGDRALGAGGDREKARMTYVLFAVLGGWSVGVTAFLLLRAVYRTLVRW